MLGVGPTLLPTPARAYLCPSTSLLHSPRVPRPVLRGHKHLGSTRSVQGTPWALVVAQRYNDSDTQGATVGGGLSALLALPHPYQAADQPCWGDVVGKEGFQSRPGSEEHLAPPPTGGAVDRDPEQADPRPNHQGPEAQQESESKSKQEAAPGSQKDGPLLWQQQILALDAPQPGGGSVAGLQAHWRASTGKEGALQLLTALKGSHRDTRTDRQTGSQPAPGGWWPATEEKGGRLPGPERPYSCTSHAHTHPHTHTR
ncbi:hypothetical protein J1605_020410 [Eschrichtius robustus]|uniref:Uncharacterized protein n=1 Tax=Eschrichtius robustus TaxID=9764 RepID=A0AB34HHD4_ESCRO|nr:hypothetical protein J1605_020410 [Eschrichtius robustus]